MGTGKSTVGKTLAGKLGRTLVDIDRKIEEREGRRIADIFKKDGESAFRTLEKQMIREAALGSNLVITTGGGAVVDPENFAALKERGLLIALEAGVETIYKRVKNSRRRPLLSPPAGQAGPPGGRAGFADVPGEIKRLLEVRKPFYDKADFKFSTDGKTSEQVADEILEKLSGEEEFEFGKDWF